MQTEINGKNARNRAIQMFCLIQEEASVEQLEQDLNHPRALSCVDCEAFEPIFLHHHVSYTQTGAWASLLSKIQTRSKNDQRYLCVYLFTHR